MSESKNLDWKILVIGRGKQHEEQIRKNFDRLGYKYITVAAIENDKADDERIIDYLEQGDWDAVSLGGGLNGYCPRYPRTVATLKWFNRLVNLIQEHAPKTKLIFVTDPDDLIRSFERILGSQEDASYTI